MSARLVAWLLLGCVAAPGAVAHAKRKPAAESPGRKLVIESFAGEGGDAARDIVLELLAGRTDRSDYTVVGHDDVEFVAKRLKVGTDSPDGRKRISEELAIDLWIDGSVDREGRGEVRLSTAQGKRLASVPLSGKTSAQANETLRAQLWKRFGPLLSPDEQTARLLQGEQARAQQKLAARRAEQARQQQLIVQHAQELRRLLEAARVQAREKQHAREQEAARQVTVVRELRLAQAREQQRREQELQQQQAAEAARQRQLAEQAERQRIAEETRQRQLAEQQAAMQAAQQPVYPATAYPPAAPANGWAPQPAPAAGHGQPAAPGYAPQPAPWQAGQPAWPPPAQAEPQPAAAAGWAPPANNPAPGWQAQPAQPAPAWQAQPAPWQQGQPQPAAGYSPPPAQPAPAVVEAESVPQVEGISPETRKWLQRKQRERAQGNAPR